MWWAFPQIGALKCWGWLPASANPQRGIFNALIIVALIPLALKAQVSPQSAAVICEEIFLYGLGESSPPHGIKLIDSCRALGLLGVARSG